MSLLVPVLVVVLAGVLTGVTGFGFSVLSVPLLLLVLPPREVVVIALCLVPLTSAVLLLSPSLRGQVRARTVGALTACSVIGLPVGIVVFEHVDPMWVTGLMGVVLAAYAGYGLAGSGRVAVHRHWVVPSGVLGGILATSTGLSGPAVAMYVHGRRVSARQQAATMAAYVGAVSILGLALLTLRGAVACTDLRLVAQIGPAAVAGTLLGRWWAGRRHDLLDRVTLVALGLMGVWTLGRALVWLTRGAWG
ncbi:TSUP family transporter [Oryzobacter sp. R7]|uniref:TSUP family transporter n=1 Tax=Oryzobacter faecalis TaxID=3388656 RepID=UPI00398D1F7B